MRFDRSSIQILSYMYIYIYIYIYDKNWSYILILFGVEWVMLRTVLELLTSWSASVGYGRAKAARRLAPLCLL